MSLVNRTLNMNLVIICDPVWEKGTSSAFYNFAGNRKTWKYWSLGENFLFYYMNLYFISYHLTYLAKCVPSKVMAYFITNNLSSSISVEISCFLKSTESIICTFTFYARVIACIHTKPLKCTFCWSYLETVWQKWTSFFVEAANSQSHSFFSNSKVNKNGLLATTIHRNFNFLGNQPLYPLNICLPFKV